MKEYEKKGKRGRGGALLAARFEKKGCHSPFSKRGSLSCEGPRRKGKKKKGEVPFSSTGVATGRKGFCSKTGALS